MKARARALAAALAVLLAACAPPRPSSPPATAPAIAAAPAFLLPATSADWYRQAARAGDTVLRVDAAQSLLVVTVRRGGPLARLGHDHVVASHALGGLVAPARGRADLGFRLDQLVVDGASLRAEARLDTVPSAEAIAGTRNNMLTRVLEAQRYPEVLLQIQALGLAPPQGPRPLRLLITLHGVSRSFDTAATVAISSSGLVASGSLTLRQSDFGITPMAILGGAMTVADSLELRYRIVATP